MYTKYTARSVHLIDIYQCGYGCSTNMLVTLRCFTFGIGSGASTALVKGIAHAGNGSAEFIADNERMQSKVSV